MHRPGASLHRAVVLGANGLVGGLLALRLAGSGVAVTGVDLHPQPAEAIASLPYMQGDATAPGEAARQALAAADVVLLCLPEPAALAALSGLLSLTAGDALVVDTLSVKQPVADARRALSATQEHLSINLMFSPKLGFSGQNVAVSPLASGPRGEEFARLLGTWGARTVQVTPAEHDQLTALMQAATHAALLALGTALCDGDYRLETALGMSTPPHRACLALLARMCAAAPEVYWDIQRSNARAPAARQALQAALARLDESVAQNQEQAFGNMLARIRNLLSPRQEDLQRCADRIGAASRLELPRIDA